MFVVVGELGGSGGLAVDGGTCGEASPVGGTRVTVSLARWNVARDGRGRARVAEVLPGAEPTVVSPELEPLERKHEGEPALPGAEKVLLLVQGAGHSRSGCGSTQRCRSWFGLRR